MESLQIPETWVYSAKVSFLKKIFHVKSFFAITVDQAARAGYDGNHRQQALHLLQAEEWNHAHSVIIDHLAADDIISGTRVKIKLRKSLKKKLRGKAFANAACA